MVTSVEYFDAIHYDFSVQKKIDNFLTPYIPCVEATAIKRTDNQLWDVFFNQYQDQIEYERLARLENGYESNQYGVYLLSATEDQIEDRFREWAENVLMQFRRQRND